MEEFQVNLNIFYSTLGGEKFTDMSATIRFFTPSLNKYCLFFLLAGSIKIFFITLGSGNKGILKETFLIRLYWLVLVFTDISRLSGEFPFFLSKFREE